MKQLVFFCISLLPFTLSAQDAISNTIRGVNRLNNELIALQKTNQAIACNPNVDNDFTKAGLRFNEEYIGAIVPLIESDQQQIASRHELFNSYTALLTRVQLYIQTKDTPISCIRWIAKFFDTNSKELSIALAAITQQLNEAGKKLPPPPRPIIPLRGNELGKLSNSLQALRIQLRI